MLVIVRIVCIVNPSMLEISITKRGCNMRQDLIKKIAKEMSLDQYLKPNSMFPKAFYNLTNQEQAETIKLYKKYRQTTGQILWDEQK
jgi:hypothetical protein